MKIGKRYTPVGRVAKPMIDVEMDRVVHGSLEINKDFTPSKKRITAVMFSVNDEYKVEVSRDEYELLKAWFENE